MQHRSLVLAASLAVSGLTANVYAQDGANSTGNTGNTLERAADRTGDALKRAADRTGDALSNVAQTDPENVKGTLETTTEAALTEDGFDDVVERFVDADRNRIGQSMPSEEQIRQLNQLTGKIKQAWQQKYNQEFAIDNRMTVFDDRYVVRAGEIPDMEARTAGERIGSNTSDRLNNTAGTSTPGSTATGADATHSSAARTGTSGSDATGASPATPGAGVAGGATGVDGAGLRTNDAGTTSGSGTVSGSGTISGRSDAPAISGLPAERNTDTGRAPGSVNTDADRNRDPGRSIANVTIPSSHGLPDLTVEMIYELPAVWKIDIPDTVDGTKLYNNLISHLQKVSDAQAQWPTEVNEAYRLVNHHVMLAILDRDASKPANPAGMNQPGQTGSGTGGM